MEGWTYDDERAAERARIRANLGHAPMQSGHSTKGIETDGWAREEARVVWEAIVVLAILGGGVVGAVVGVVLVFLLH